MNCTVMGSCWSTVKKIQDIKYHWYSEICCEIWFKLIPQFKHTYVHAGHSGTTQSFLSWILIHLLHLASRQPWRMHICFIKLTTNVNFKWYSSWYCCIYDTSECDISAYGYTCRSKEHKNMYSLYIYYYDWLSLFSQVNDGCAILGHTCNWNQL